MLCVQSGGTRTARTEIKNFRFLIDDCFLKIDPLIPQLLSSTVTLTYTFYMRIKIKVGMNESV